jgi:hypothetical protein
MMLRILATTVIAVAVVIPRRIWIAHTPHA